MHRSCSVLGYPARILCHRLVFSISFQPPTQQILSPHKCATVPHHRQILKCPNKQYLHFRGKEDSTSVRPTYMENQTHINERMRAILVDWLVEVHLKFKLVPETLYLTVNLIDRYLEGRR